MYHKPRFHALGPIVYARPPFMNMAYPVLKPHLSSFASKPHQAPAARKLVSVNQ